MGGVEEVNAALRQALADISMPEAAQDVPEWRPRCGQRRGSRRLAILQIKDHHLPLCSHRLRLR